MMDFDQYVINWNEEKNIWLKQERKVSFEDVLVEIEEGRILDIILNSNKKYICQYVLILEINEYIHLVPFVINEKEGEIFLKTIYPSRKYTKLYNNK